MLCATAWNPPVPDSCFQRRRRFPARLWPFCLQDGAGARHSPKRVRARTVVCERRTWDHSTGPRDAVAGRRKALLEAASLLALCSSRHLPCVCDIHLDLSPAPAPQIGSRYTLVRVLGYGSFSAVCLAVDQETGEKVGGRYGGAQSSLQPGPNTGLQVAGRYAHEPGFPPA